MKRLHVHVSVGDLAESIRFYSTLFGADPTVREQDYAKWMLDDPRVNFAISDRGAARGLDHLGVQVESEGELREIAARLAAADRPLLEQKDTSCCYARGDKAWSRDPQGVRWETFLTRGALTVYGSDAPRISEKACGCDADAPARSEEASPSACC
jgi:catechol 2,3-dioxygenase-like lactoylglutathione lyase family enzyme